MSCSACGLIRYFAQLVAHSIDPVELRTQWQTVFCVAAGVHVAGAAFFAAFAQAEVQDWALPGGHKLHPGQPRCVPVCASIPDSM
jgi:hypothetical protein